MGLIEDIEKFERDMESGAYKERIKDEILEFILMKKLLTPEQEKAFLEKIKSI